MTKTNLLKKLIKYAYQNPTAQPQLLPVIQNHMPMYYQLVPVQQPMQPAGMVPTPFNAMPSTPVVPQEFAIPASVVTTNDMGGVENSMEPQRNNFYDIQKIKNQMIEHIEQAIKNVNTLQRLIKDYQIENSYSAFLEVSEVYSCLKEEKIKLEKSLGQLELMVSQMRAFKDSASGT